MELYKFSFFAQFPKKNFEYQISFVRFLLMKQRKCVILYVQIYKESIKTKGKLYSFYNRRR